MAFCMNCGKELPEGAKFCSECGKATSVDFIANTSRKAEYVGSVRKCPSCGEELSGVVAVCPSCGYELNDIATPESLKEFIAKIENLDETISRENNADGGWSSWDSILKIIFVIANIVFVGIPIAVYLIVSFLGVNSTPKLSSAEKKKADLIENFTFPNDKDSITNAILFIKAKTAFLASGKVTKKTKYWMRVWSTKAEHLDNKAKIFFPNDRIVESAIEDIYINKNKIKTIAKRKMIVGFIILALVACLIYIPKVVDTIKEKREIEEKYNTTFEWPDGGYATQLPSPDTEFGEIDDNNDKRFSIDLYQVTPDMFKAYVEKCKDRGFTINMTENDDVFYAYNQNEMDLNIFYHKEEETMEIFLDAPEKVKSLRWPSGDLPSKLPKISDARGFITSNDSNYFCITIADISDEKFEEYVERCMDSGFTKEYTYDNGYFSAKNKQGNDLTVKKELFNKMSIRIELYEDAMWDD